MADTPVDCARTALVAIGTMLLNATEPDYSIPSHKGCVSALRYLGCSTIQDCVFYGFDDAQLKGK